MPTPVLTVPSWTRWQDVDQDADQVLDSLEEKGVATVAKLMRSDRMVTLLRRIGELQDPEIGEKEGVKIEEAIKEEPGAERGGSTDEEYRLIVECNEIVGDIALEAPSAFARLLRETARKQDPMY